MSGRGSTDAQTPGCCVEHPKQFVYASPSPSSATAMETLRMQDVVCYNPL